MKNLNYIVCTLLVIFFMSCGESVKTKSIETEAGETEVPLLPVPPDSSKTTTTINVYIENDSVKLSSNGNAVVMSNTYVQWNVTNPQLKITNIAPKKDSASVNTNIWVENPQPNRSHKIWRGLVFGQTGSEYYDVDWERTNKGVITTGAIDPVIKVEVEP